MLGWLVILTLTVLIVGGFAGLALWVGNRMAAADDAHNEMMREQYRQDRLRNPYARNCGDEVVAAPAEAETPPLPTGPPPVPSNAPMRAELIEDDELFEDALPDLPTEERARQAWPTFLRLWEAHHREQTHRFLIRTPLHGPDAVESCWLRPTTIDGPQYIVIGVVARPPMRMTSVRKGERVRVRLGSDLRKLEDWQVETPTGTEGAFG
ncbi:MAG: DUF2314 domain-containing protein [Planctomycetota bacterium]